MDIDVAAKTFLSLDRIAVVGVSRKGESPANAIATRLREDGRQVFAVNPSGEPIDGHPTWSELGAIPGGVQGVVVVTRPEQATRIAAQARGAGAEWIWFHQGMGPVSYDDQTLKVARDAGLHVISVGCPMMYCNPDGVHACARWLFRAVGRIPREIEV